MYRPKRSKTREFIKIEKNLRFPSDFYEAKNEKAKLLSVGLLFFRKPVTFPPTQRLQRRDVLQSVSWIIFDATNTASSSVRGISRQTDGGIYESARESNLYPPLWPFVKLVQWFSKPRRRRRRLRRHRCRRCRLSCGSESAAIYRRDADDNISEFLMLPAHNYTP